jgi:hypothetical protein
MRPGADETALLFNRARGAGGLRQTSACAGESREYADRAREDAGLPGGRRHREAALRVCE